MIHLILLGPPGAGKGTQSAQLASRLGVLKIATGDILRAAVRDGTPLGSEAKNFMEAGELVPDALILGFVREALADDAARAGAVFDGFPRNVAQAESLAEILAAAGRDLDAVVVLDVPDDVIVERMSGRYTDPVTGQVYHLKHNPPPADVAERVVQRPDDREDTVRHRLAVYARETEPLISHYRNGGVPIHSIDGTQVIDRVQADILSAIRQ
jgi:adenylate kinase